MDYISLSLHTRYYAENLKRLLSDSGVDVQLMPYAGEATLSAEHIYSLQVRAEDVLTALRIIEGAEQAGRFKSWQKMLGGSDRLLIPVDFSKMNMVGCRAGFELAERLDLHPVLLHAYPLGASPTEPDCETPDAAGRVMDEVVEAAEFVRSEERIRLEAESRMLKLAEEVRMAQKSGLMAERKFSVRVKPGLPETVIADYVKTHRPPLVVMATRGQSKRAMELIGSVTAEVLDDCKAPIFTVPENYTFCGIRNITRLVFFCSLDRQDIASFDTLMRMFGFPEIDVWIVPVPDRHAAGSKSKGKGEDLRGYLTTNYPMAKFEIAWLESKDFNAQLSELVKREGLQMMIVPNKRKNIFARLFNPGIAHKFLFEQDLPMLALPV